MRAGCSVHICVGARARAHRLALLAQRALRVGLVGEGLVEAADLLARLVHGRREPLELRNLRLGGEGLPHRRALERGLVAELGGGHARFLPQHVGLRAHLVAQPLREAGHAARHDRELGAERPVQKLPPTLRVDEGVPAEALRGPV